MKYKHVIASDPKGLLRGALPAIWQAGKQSGLTRRLLRPVHPLAVLAMTVLPTVFALAAALTLDQLALPKSFLIKSPYYKVESTVTDASEPGFLKFRVAAPHATYDAEGLAPFQKLLREAEVIERVRRDEEGSSFFGGAGDSIKSTGEGAVKLVTHPIASAKGVGKAAGTLGRKIGGIFRKKEEGEETTFSEKLLGGSERELAAKFGVDVYSTNPYLRTTLTNMAKARMGGKGAAFIGKMLLPVAGLVSVAITASGVNGAADQFVNNHSKGDLYYHNQNALLDLGFLDRDIKRLLNKTIYSPREATYLRFYLDKLKGFDGFREVFKSATRANTLWEGRKVLYVSQILSDAVGPGLPFEKIEMTELGLATAKDSKAILIAPYDYLDQSGLGRRVSEAAVSLKRERQKSSVEIWNAGKISLGFSSVSLTKGIKARGWALFSRMDEEA